MFSRFVLRIFHKFFCFLLKPLTKFFENANFSLENRANNSSKESILKGFRKVRQTLFGNHYFSVKTKHSLQHFLETIKNHEIQETKQIFDQNELPKTCQYFHPFDGPCNGGEPPQTVLSIRIPYR